MDKKKYTLNEARKNTKNFVSYLKKEHKFPVRKVYIFGSYAKGKQRDWSDVDICIISPKFKKTDAISYLFQKLRRQDIEHLIEPIGFHPDDFKQDNPLIREIKKTGKEIKI